MDPEVLKKAPLFARLEDDSATALASAMGTIRLKKGEVLFHEGDSEDRLYVVVSGKIKLGRSGSAGRENLLAVLGPGQMFGELSVFDPGPRSTTATAVTACEIRTLEHDELMGWLTGRPEVAQGLLGQMAARLRRANDVVADLVFSDVPGRVAKQLLELAKRFGDPARRRRTRAPRSDPGGAGPARRSLPGDGEQGPGRLRGPRLDPPRAALGHHPRRRAGRAPRALSPWLPCSASEQPRPLYHAERCNLCKLSTAQEASLGVRG